MILTVNGSEHPLAEPCALADLVGSVLGDRQACGVAVAVNETVVQRSAWEQHLLHDGDRVDIVTAVQGG